MNEVFFKIYKSIPVNRCEVFRYMSCGQPDETTEKLLDLCIAESESELSYKVSYSFFNIFAKGDELELEFARTKSHALSVNLRGCGRIIVFAATVGHGLDRLIKKEALLSPAKALCLQALGSERVESLCDAFNKDIKADFEKQGFKLKPRFSPGYGDLSIEIQRDLLPALDSAKLLGISLGDNLMMSPSKSVTAIIGICDK